MQNSKCSSVKECSNKQYNNALNSFTVDRSPFTMRYPFTIYGGKWLMANGKGMVNGQWKMVNGSGGACLWL